VFEFGRIYWEKAAEILLLLQAEKYSEIEVTEIKIECQEVGHTREFLSPRSPPPAAQDRNRICVPRTVCVACEL
jgi:hypothetical protein